MSSRPLPGVFGGFPVVLWLIPRRFQKFVGRFLVVVQYTRRRSINPSIGRYRTGGPDRDSILPDPENDVYEQDGTIRVDTDAFWNGALQNIGIICLSLFLLESS